MQTLTCDNCGASIDPAAKFCRQCGRPQDASELTTRQLQEPARIEAPTRPANSGFTAPAYLQPDPYSMQAPATRGIEAPGQKKTIITLSILVAVLLIAMSGLAFYMIARNSGSPPGGNIPALQTPEAPPPPGGPGGIVKPPKPPVAPSAPGAETTIEKDLIYPGAKIAMEAGSKDEGKVVQLSTTDDFDKVVDWYIEKIKPKNRVRIPGTHTVLEGEGVAVIINSGGGVTNIMVTQDYDK